MTSGENITFECLPSKAERLKEKMISDWKSALHAFNNEDMQND